MVQGLKTSSLFERTREMKNKIEEIYRIYEMTFGYI
jgi:hypothetical protein